MGRSGGLGCCKSARRKKENIWWHFKVRFVLIYSYHCRNLGMYHHPSLCMHKMWVAVDRNNWVRLKRYLEIDFTNQRRTDEAEWAGLEKMQSSVSFENVSGDFFTGKKRIMLPSSVQDLSSGETNSKLYDTRQFFLYSDRKVLYRNIERRCEVRQIHLPVILFGLIAYIIYLLGHDFSWHIWGDSVLQKLSIFYWQWPGIIGGRKSFAAGHSDAGPHSLQGNRVQTGSFFNLCPFICCLLCILNIFSK